MDFDTDKAIYSTICPRNDQREIRIICLDNNGNIDEDIEKIIIIIQ